MTWSKPRVTEVPDRGLLLAQHRAAVDAVTLYLRASVVALIVPLVASAGAARGREADFEVAVLTLHRE